MIGEILTGVFAGVTVGYLWARDRHHKKSPIDRITDNKYRMRKMAGVEAVDMAASSQTKNNDEPFWWQKFENQKMVMSTGKFPETQEELEKHLGIQRQELKRDEMIYYLDQEKCKEREAERKKWEEGNAELAKQMLATHKKKEEERS